MATGTRSRGKGLGDAADLISSECIAVRLRMLNRVVSNIYDEALRPLGLKVGQVNILVVVKTRGPISPGQVATVLQMDKSTLSRNLAPLQRQGWIDTRPGEDARSHELVVTKKGTRLIEKTLPLWRASQRRVRALLGDSGERAIDTSAKAIWSRAGVERK